MGKLCYLSLYLSIYIFIAIDKYIATDHCFVIFLSLFHHLFYTFPTLSHSRILSRISCPQTISAKLCQAIKVYTTSLHDSLRDFISCLRFPMWDPDLITNTKYITNKNIEDTRRTKIPLPMILTIVFRFLELSL